MEQSGRLPQKLMAARRMTRWKAHSNAQRATHIFEVRERSIYWAY